MAYKTPQEVAAVAVVSGVHKARMSVTNALVGGFLAGAYIGFGSMVAIAVSSGLDPKTWGTLPTLFTGAVFSLGLILVVVGGAELLTGNMAVLPLALLRRKISIGQLGVNWGLVLVGNLLGSLVVAYFLAIKTGVIGGAGSSGPALLEYKRLAAIATGKALSETDWQIFLRAIGCNWLVCLAVWLAFAAEDIGGKILAIFFPITAFVAMGFDHVVANMFFLPAAMFAHVPGLGWGNVVNNLVWAFLGNTIGGAFFVGGLYWFLYLRNVPDDDPAGAVPAGGQELSSAVD